MSDADAEALHADASPVLIEPGDLLAFSGTPHCLP